MGNDDDDDTAPRAPPIPPDGGWRTMEAAAALVPELLDIVQASDNSTRMFDRLGRTCCAPSSSAGICASPAAI
jgi:hypothetical protein